MMFSTSSPTYPASVSVVASAMVNGTSRMRARVCASSVLPEPVGPTRRMLDFANSTAGTFFDQGHAFVMVVHGDRKHAFGAILADDVIIQHLADFLRSGDAVGFAGHAAFVR